MASNIQRTGESGNITIIAAKDNAHVGNISITVNITGTVTVEVDELQKQTREDIKLWTKDTVEPSSLQNVLKKIQTGSACVTITGSPGEGKSTLGYWVLSQLQEARPVYTVRSPVQFEKVIKTCAPVILLDDIFGQTVFSETDWKEWKVSLQQFIDMPTKEKGNLILILRNFVLKSGSRKTEDPWEMLMKKGSVVNISSEVRENEDKINILNSIAKKYEMHLDSNTIEEICSIETPHGFPHACKLFLTLHKNDGRISSVDFFNQPLEFLKVSLKILLQNEDIELIFVKIIQGNGHVVESELSKYKLITLANDLCPTYLKPDRKGYAFDHPSIFDTVAFLLCETKLAFILDNCGITFIRERIWLETPDGKKRDETADGDKLMKEIPWKEAEKLAIRFGKAIGGGNRWDVTDHNAWKSDMFVKLVIQNMSVAQLNVHDMRVGETLLYHLCEENRVDCGKMCVQRGADVNSQDERGCTALHRAAVLESTDVVSELLECGADVNSQDNRGWTALHHAAKNGRTEAAIVLLEGGADANSQDETALHHAAMNGRTELVSVLLEGGADVNSQDTIGETALHYAVINGRREAASALLEGGADVNSQDEDGRTALHQAAMYGCPEVVSALLEGGAEANSRNKEGWTALHKAAMYGRTEVVSALLEGGADVNITGKKGNTALDLARQQGRCETGHVLMAAGGISIPSSQSSSTFRKTAMVLFIILVVILIFTALVRQQSAPGSLNQTSSNTT